MGPSPNQERVLIQLVHASEASYCGIEAHRTRNSLEDSERVQERIDLIPWCSYAYIFHNKIKTAFITYVFAKIFIEKHNETMLLSQEVVSLSDKTNILLNRREIAVLFKEQAGKLGRTEAAEAVAKRFGLNVNCVIPMKLKSERGKKDLTGIFYAFNTEEDTKSRVPRYRLLRNLSKEERKKVIEEEKAAKIKAKQMVSSESKGAGKGR